MGLIVHIIMWDAVKVLIALMALVYLGLVLTGYTSEGPRYQPRLSWAEPGRSGERLLVWIGIKGLYTLLRMARSMFNQLFMASADIGFWFVNKSTSEVQRKVRSRFL
ncbi:MAG: hypothetical protein ACRD3O_12570 [Terriglobia bacterium]